MLSTKFFLSMLISAASASTDATLGCAESRSRSSSSFSGSGSTKEEEKSDRWSERECLPHSPIVSDVKGGGGGRSFFVSPTTATAPSGHPATRHLLPTRRQQRSRVSSTLLLSHAMMIVILFACFVARMTEARPCTPGPNIINATVNASNESQALNATGSWLPDQNATAWSNGTNATNATNATADAADTTGIPATTPAPECTRITGCFGLPTPPPEPSLDDLPTIQPMTPPPIVNQALDTKNKVTSELDILNSTIYNTLRQDMFAGLTLPEEANSILAASLIVAGVVSCFMGHRYMKVTVSFVAFCAGSVASMYPIDKVLGGTLCGEYVCSAGVADDLFCQWSFVAGMGIGLVCGGAAMRLIDAGSVIMGASIGLLVGLLFQPAVDQMLVTANTPGWSHFLHYIFFFGAGAGFGKMHPVALQISMSAVMGSLMAGSGLSFFADGALSPAAMMSGRPIDCGGGCVGICCGAVALAFVGMFIQTRLHKRKQESESGELAEAKLEETLGATLKLVEKVREREERVKREEARRESWNNHDIYPDLDSCSSDDRV